VLGSSRLARTLKDPATTVEPMIPEKAALLSKRGDSPERIDRSVVTNFASRSPEALELPLGLLLSRDAVAPVHGNHYTIAHVRRDLSDHRTSWVKDEGQSSLSGSTCGPRKHHASTVII
jgi:hypothetical protein